MDSKGREGRTEKEAGGEWGGSKEATGRVRCVMRTATKTHPAVLQEIPRPPSDCHTPRGKPVVAVKVFFLSFCLRVCYTCACVRVCVQLSKKIRAYRKQARVAFMCVLHGSPSTERGAVRDHVDSQGTVLSHDLHRPSQAAHTHNRRKVNEAYSDTKWVQAQSR